mmetsp:Transcript_73095/g.165797  ORF Transcript_73095/g.165797 Transcript_73095/m.165797 type:complete len:200 (+) Transcript_73095:2257-2856(+)
MYSCQPGLAMYSLHSSFHAAIRSFRATSQSYFVLRSAWDHSAFSLLTSSIFSFLFLGGASASASAFLLLPTKTANGDFGGSCGASDRNRKVTTFIASFMNSSLIFFSRVLNVLNLGPSLNALTSSIHFCFSSFSFWASSAFSDSGAWSNLTFNAERPLPSPLPGSTSLLWMSAYIAKAFFGLLGSSRMLRSLFSLALTC